MKSFLIPPALAIIGTFLMGAFIPTQYLYLSTAYVLTVIGVGWGIPLWRNVLTGGPAFLKRETEEPFIGLLLWLARLSLFVLAVTWTSFITDGVLTTVGHHVEVGFILLPTLLLPLIWLWGPPICRAAVAIGNKIVLTWFSLMERRKERRQYAELLRVRKLYDGGLLTEDEFQQRLVTIKTK